MAKNIVLRSKLEGAGKTKRGLKSVDSGLRNLGRSALNAGAAYFGARGLISGFKAAIEAAGQQELAEKKLETALGKTSKTLLNYASALQKSTTFGDEATIEAMSMMAAFTKDEEALKKLTAVTLDYAAATGTDLHAASQLVGRTFGTSMNAMSRYGVAVEGAAGSTERLESLTENLAKMFGGQAAAQAQTMSGQIEQMKNVLGDTAELIGTALGPSLVKFAKQTKEVAEFWIDFVGAGKDADDTFKKFSDDTTVKMNQQIKQLNENIAFGTERLKDLNAGTKDRIMLEKRAEEQGRTFLEQQVFEINITRNLIAQRDELKEKLDSYIESQKVEVEILSEELLPRFRDWNAELGSIGELATIFSEEDAPMMIDSFDIIAASLQSNVDYTKEFGEALKQAKMDAATSIGGLLGSFASLNSAAKGGFLVTARLQQAAAFANTYSSATAAIAPPPVGYGPTPMGFIAAATAIASGLANIVQIENSLSQMQSAATGFDGIVNKPTMFMTGEAGAERVSVTPLEGPNINGPQGGVTINISAPLIDETVVDSIIPAIEKAQRLNLA